MTGKTVESNMSVEIPHCSQHGPGKDDIMNHMAITACYRLYSSVLCTEYYQVAICDMVELPLAAYIPAIAL